ncbi:MAG: helix-hairpin-helix domain-containing protein [Flavobacteriales bacterium]|nr:helix-hairpin-helix domain-containing protein [Flavobacteriales bacterium]
MPKKIPSYLVFTKEQRNGILLLFILILLLQLAYYFLDFSSASKTNPEKEQWLALQIELDSLKQNQPDSSYKMYPFNPNFITDFKGYKLGMSVEQIDRLLAFRKQNKFVNSAEEFQKITGVSDSLLKTMKPFFKFPDWVNNKQSTFQSKSNWIDYSKKKDNVKQKVIVIDINLATKDDLMKVYGIGDAISDRILKQREIYGNFVSMEQMNDIWGLSPEVIEKLNQQFAIISKPNPKKININQASIKELGQFPYFRYPISKNIVSYRSMNGDLKIDDLTKIKEMPNDKIKIIALYLEF